MIFMSGGDQIPVIMVWAGCGRRGAGVGAGGRHRWRSRRLKQGDLSGDGSVFLECRPRVSFPLQRP